MKPFRFGIVGEYQSGKSLLINCILHRSIATVGVGLATTHTIVNYIYAEKEYVVYKTDDGVCNSLSIDELKELDTRSDNAEINVYLSNERLRNFILTDMPGFGANEKDNLTTRRTLREIDFAILIAWNDKVMGADSQSYNEIKALKTLNIPYYFFLNCTNTDRWRCDDDGNIHIAQRNLTLLDFHRPSCYPVSTTSVNIVNLMWYWYSICDDDDELISRKKNVSAFKEYGINKHVKQDVGKASNFHLITKIFSLDNRVYLELRREFKEELSKLRNEVCPIGTIQAFAYNSIPKGWMLCDGRKLDPTIHTELYDAIGTTFGGDGKSFFQIPDLRGCFVRGWDELGKIDKDRTFGTFQEDSIHNHSHKVDSCSENGRHFHYIGYKHYPTQESNIAYTTYQHEHITDHGDSNKKGNRNTDHDGNHKHEIKIGSATKYGQTDCIISNETRPKNVALIFCIKINPLVNDGIIENDDTNKKVNNTEVSQENEDSVSPTTEELNYNDIMSKLIKLIKNE